MIASFFVYLAHERSMLFFHLGTCQLFRPQVGYGIFAHRGRQVGVEIRELFAQSFDQLFRILAIRFAVERTGILEWRTAMDRYRLGELRFAEIDERTNDSKVLA